MRPRYAMLLGISSEQARAYCSRVVETRLAEGAFNQGVGPLGRYGRCIVKESFREIVERLVEKRIAGGEDPAELFEELMREANLVFGRYSLEYELGLALKKS